ncbi:MAG: right-handed parallel beta-helix repeat-containing protein [Candidatus Solibacter usitatus]|nr:right-handed parallel beta-helix repeat-containing protein [Candidatus Solibacter usitatus]
MSTIGLRGIIWLAAALVLMMPGFGLAATDCTFTISRTTMTLNSDCNTDASIIVPNGFTLDGAGHTITAKDPAGGHFVGGVIQNGGASANVTHLTIATSGLANVCDAGGNRLRGILFDGASGRITDNRVMNINQGASGCQEGNGIEVRNFGSNPRTLHVTIDGNVVINYQKTGIVVNGNADGSVTDNVVAGAGPVGYIARNGIQVGYGASALVKRNQVTGNSYTGSSTVSGGIIVVGGPGYGGAFCIGVDISQNELDGNDVGVFISQYEADWSAPAAATNIKVVNNTIQNNAVTNGYIYQAGVSDVGNNDKIIANRISGAGYDPATLPGSTFEVDADSSFTNRPKVHANK